MFANIHFEWTSWNFNVGNSNPDNVPTITFGCISDLSGGRIDGSRDVIKINSTGADNFHPNFAVTGTFGVNFEINSFVDTDSTRL